MTHPALSDEQAARADALDVAHSILSGSTVKGPLSMGSRAGLITEELLPAVRLAEYVLTGKYLIPAATDPDAEDLETIAGATGSTEAGYL